MVINTTHSPGWLHMYVHVYKEETEESKAGRVQLGQQVPGQPGQKSRAAELGTIKRKCEKNF